MNRLSKWLPCLVGLILISGCGYPEVSPLTYEYSKAIYSIANQKDLDRLKIIESKINAAATTGELTDDESKWLGEMIADATSGDWDRASQSARRLMMDQVETTKSP